MTEINDEELERLMRRKLLLDGPSNRGVSFNDEERRMAEKLLGKDETRRLEGRRDNARPFRPKPPLVVAEYYEVPSIETSWSVIDGGWRIDVRENGKLHKSAEHLTRDECLKIVAGLERRGAKIKPIETEWMKQTAASRKTSTPTRLKTTENQRKAILDDLSDFKIGGA